MFLLSELDDYKQIKTADRGHYYTSGSGIEFLRNEEVYDYDIGVWENAEIIYVAKSLQ